MSKELPAPMRTLGDISADLLQAFSRLREAAQKPCRLDKKTKRLALTAAYAAIGCVDCLAGCIIEGLREGVGLDELLEAASIAVLIHGAEAVITIHKAVSRVKNKTK